MNYPLWLEIILATAMSFALAGLGAWMFCTFATKALNSASRLEEKRANRETDALDSWRTAYEAERKDHLEDVAELTNRIFALEKEIKIKNSILQKVKVKDL